MMTPTLGADQSRRRWCANGVGAFLRGICNLRTWTVPFSHLP